MSDLDKAMDTCLEFIRNRPRIQGQLLTYLNDGIRAQCVEQDRSTGVVVVKEEGDDTGRPMVADPTAAAAGRRDGMRRLLEETEQAEAKLIAAANRLIGHTFVTHIDHLAQVLDAYRGRDDLTNHQIKASARVFQSAMSHTIDVNTDPTPGLSVDGKPGCTSCARLKVDGRPWWSDPNYHDGIPTDLGEALKRRHSLCRACYRFAINQDPIRLPSVDELRHRHADARGHWPTRHGKAA